MQIQTCHGLLTRTEDLVELGPEPIFEPRDPARVRVNRDDDVVQRCRCSHQFSVARQSAIPARLPAIRCKRSGGPCSRADLARLLDSARIDRMRHSTQAPAPIIQPSGGGAIRIGSRIALSARDGIGIGLVPETIIGGATGALLAKGHK